MKDGCVINFASIFYSSNDIFSNLKDLNDSC